MVKLWVKRAQNYCLGNVTEKRVDEQKIETNHECK